MHCTEQNLKEKYTKQSVMLISNDCYSKQDIAIIKITYVSILASFGVGDFEGLEIYIAGHPFGSSHW